jgi:hypothetical protein
MRKEVIGRFVNTSPQTFTEASNILFNQITTTSSTLGYNTDGSISIKTPGLYKIYVNVTIVGTATGDVSVSLLEGINSIPGAAGTETISTIGDKTNIAFSTIVTVKANCGTTFATLNLNCGNAATINVVNLIIERVD